MKKKHLLLIRSGYPSKEFVLKKLKELGYYLIVLDKEINCPDGLVDEWIITDTYNEKEAIKAVGEYLTVKNNYIDGAFTVWEEAVLTTAAITEYFGWPGVPFKTAQTIKNKFFFRELCEQYNLPTPNHHLLRTKSDFKEIAEKLSFPVVVKPIYGAASAFVIKVNALQELKKVYKGISSSIKNFWLAPEWKSNELFVEEYIEGQEVDIDILIQNGKCMFYSISDNFQTSEPYFVETGQAIPSSLPKSQKDALIDMALTVLNVAGVKNGCIHFEAKSSPGGPVPIEINLRMGGDEVYSFIKEAWRVDMIENAAKIAVGENIDVVKPRKPYKYLEGKYFLPKKKGIITNIKINETLLNNKSLFELHLSKKIGDFINVPPSDFDYFGWITMKGSSALEAKSALENIYREIDFVTKDLNDQIQQTI